MKTVTLEIDDKTFRNAAELARRRGVSTEVLLGQTVQREIERIGGDVPSEKDQTAARNKLVKLFSSSTWDPDPNWRWSREDTYAERLSRHEHIALRGEQELVRDEET